MDINWSSVVPTLVGGILAISGAILAQIYIKHKEKETKKEQMDSDGRLLGALLSVRLETWMSSCSVAAADRHDPVTQYYYDQLELTSVGPFVLDDIKGNWLTLSPKLIKEIHELPVKLEQTNDEIYKYAKATRDSSRQRWGDFLILRAESYHHLSGQISVVCSQLYNETGMGIPSFFPGHSPKNASPEKRLYKQWLRWWLPSGAFGVLIIALLIYVLDPGLESRINQGHYWADCMIVRHNLDSGMFTENQHVLKCGNRYEVISVGDYERAARAWQQIQEFVKVPESAAARAAPSSD